MLGIRVRGRLGYLGISGERNLTVERPPCLQLPLRPPRSRPHYFLQSQWDLVYFSPNQIQLLSDVYFSQPKCKTRIAEWELSLRYLLGKTRASMLAKISRSAWHDKLSQKRFKRTQTQSKENELLAFVVVKLSYNGSSSRMCKNDMVNSTMTA